MEPNRRTHIEGRYTTMPCISNPRCWYREDLDHVLAAGDEELAQQSYCF